jgi:hypothetical protein
MVEDRQREDIESNVALAVAVSCPTYPPVDSDNLNWPLSIVTEKEGFFDHC